MIQQKNVTDDTLAPERIVVLLRRPDSQSCRGRPLFLNTDLADQTDWNGFLFVSFRVFRGSLALAALVPKQRWQDLAPLLTKEGWQPLRLTGWFSLLRLPRFVVLSLWLPSFRRRGGSRFG